MSPIYEVPVTMHVTQQDIDDIIETACYWEWWVNLTGPDLYGVYTITWCDPDDPEGQTTDTRFSPGAIALRLSEYLVEQNTSLSNMCSDLTDRLDVGQLDVTDCDTILQRVVFGGEVVYG